MVSQKLKEAEPICSFSFILCNGVEDIVLGVGKIETRSESNEKTQISAGGGDKKQKRKKKK